jgi:hypothetical protein
MLNLDNEAYVEGLLKEKINNNDEFDGNNIMQ